MKMTSDRLKVEIVKQQELHTKSGIYLGDADPITGSVQNYHKGIVLEAGNGARATNGELIPMQCKVGDVIMYPTNPYKIFEDEEKPYHILHDCDVWAIFEGEHDNGTI